jgi:hypothetical protein
MMSQTLKNVVWQSRNQALHWEEGRFSQAVETCFRALATDYDPKFGSTSIRNMAADVIELLGWRTWDDFEHDMSLLAQRPGAG